MIYELRFLIKRSLIKRWLKGIMAAAEIFGISVTVKETLLFQDFCLRSSIYKADEDKWGCYSATNGHIVSGRFEWHAGVFLCN